MTDWFQPRRLYVDGYPRGVTSALRELGDMRSVVRAEIARLAPATLLEVGPGDAPVAEGLPGAVLMDAVPRFLAPLEGARVVGDLFAAPFEPATFDLVVASDVLTHIRPGLRRDALAAMSALGRDMIYFNPTPGHESVEGSRVAQPMVRAFFESAGFTVEERSFRARGAAIEYPMFLLTARR